MAGIWWFNGTKVAVLPPGLPGIVYHLLNITKYFLLNKDISSMAILYLHKNKLQNVKNSVIGCVIYKKDEKFITDFCDSSSYYIIISELTSTLGGEFCQVLKSSRWLSIYILSIEALKHYCNSFEFVTFLSEISPFLMILGSESFPVTSFKLLNSIFHQTSKDILLNRKHFELPSLVFFSFQDEFPTPQCG